MKTKSNDEELVADSSKVADGVTLQAEVNQLKKEVAALVFMNNRYITSQFQIVLFVPQMMILLMPQHPLMHRLELPFVYAKVKDPAHPLHCQAQTQLCCQGPSQLLCHLQLIRRRKPGSTLLGTGRTRPLSLGC